MISSKQAYKKTRITISDTHLQWRRDSYRSASVITVLPLYLWVTSSLQHPTSKYVLGNLKLRSKQSVYEIERSLNKLTKEKAGKYEIYELRGNGIKQMRSLID